VELARIIAIAARHAPIEKAEKRNGSMPPTNRAAMTFGSVISIRSLAFSPVRVLVGNFPGGLEGGEQRQRGERGRADREALADRGGGVADGVELVGAAADLLFGSSLISAMPPALSAIGP
jgi:hypothetical protein